MELDQFGQILANNGTFVVESRDDTSTGRNYVPW